MNRETRRRLKQNEVVKRSFIPTDASKLLERQKIGRAIDEGILLGFSAASHMIEKVAKGVAGIGDKRAKMLREAFEAELKSIQAEIKK
jgi:hypothetical protein